MTNIQRKFPSHQCLLLSKNLRILVSEKELPDSSVCLLLHEITLLHELKYHFRSIDSKEV